MADSSICIIWLIGVEWWRILISLTIRSRFDLLQSFTKDRLLTHFIDDLLGFATRKSTERPSKLGIGLFEAEGAFKGEEAFTSLRRS